MDALLHQCLLVQAGTLVTVAATIYIIHIYNCSASLSSVSTKNLVSTTRKGVPSKVVSRFSIEQLVAMGGRLQFFDCSSADTRQLQQLLQILPNKFFVGKKKNFVVPRKFQAFIRRLAFNFCLESQANSGVVDDGETATTRV